MSNSGMAHGSQAMFGVVFETRLKCWTKSHGKVTQGGTVVSDFIGMALIFLSMVLELVDG